MPQIKYDIAIDDQATADEFVKKTNDIQGVKWINVNVGKGSVVVTHDDSFDEDAFKAAAGI